MTRLMAGIATVLGLIAPIAAGIPDSFTADGVERIPIETKSTPAGTARIQVIEVFSYGCGHCYRMEPYIAQWLKSKPEYVDFIRMHIPERGQNGAYGRLFYTLRALGRLDLHPAIFASIFEQNDPLNAPTEDAAFKAQLAFATRNGIDAEAFTETYRSLALTEEIQHTRDLLRGFRIDATPTIVVNGKYRVVMKEANHQQAVMSAVDATAAQEYSLKK